MYMVMIMIQMHHMVMIIRIIITTIIRYAKGGVSENWGLRRKTDVNWSDLQEAHPICLALSKNIWKRWKENKNRSWNNRCFHSPTPHILSIRRKKIPSINQFNKMSPRQQLRRCLQCVSKFLYFCCIFDLRWGFGGGCLEIIVASNYEARGLMKWNWDQKRRKCVIGFCLILWCYV